MKNNQYNVYVRSTNQKFNSQQFNCGSIYFRRTTVMLTSGERFTNVGLSPLFFTSLLGVEEKVKEVDVSCFKEGEKWRWNEPQKVIQYFSCNMKVLANEVGLNATEISTILDKSIPVVSNWMNGRDMPPSDIQEMIAQLVGAKSRAEVWPYKGEDITKYRIELNKLQREEIKIKKLIQNKLKREV